jgi:hypothetical protein
MGDRTFKFLSSLWLAFLLTERKNGNGNLFSKLELWVIGVLSIPCNKKFWDGLGHL